MLLLAMLSQIAEDKQNVIFAMEEAKPPSTLCTEADRSRGQKAVRSCCHGFRRNRLSRPPHCSAPSSARLCVRVASRHPDSGHALLPPDDPQVRSIKADVHDERSVADTLADAYGAVNAVSLYVEQGRETFHSVHVEISPTGRSSCAASRSRTAHTCSGIGANPQLAIALHP